MLCFVRFFVNALIVEGVNLSPHITHPHPPHTHTHTHTHTHPHPPHTHTLTHPHTFHTHTHTHPHRSSVRAVRLPMTVLLRRSISLPLVSSHCVPYIVTSGSTQRNCLSSMWACLPASDRKWALTDVTPAASLECTSLIR